MRTIGGKVEFVKEDVKMCTVCLPTKVAERVMTIAHITVTQPKRHLRAVK